MIDPEVVDALVAARCPGCPITAAPLTTREREILARWRRARTTPPSPRSLVISERAVEKHINAIFFKLGLSQEPDVHRRVMAVLVFLGALCRWPGADTRETDGGDRMGRPTAALPG